MQKPPPLLQPIVDLDPGRRTPSEAYAAALKLVERECNEAQAAVGRDDSDENRARCARALYEQQQLKRMLPFVEGVDSEPTQA
jgi:hypothetical protein